MHQSQTHQSNENNIQECNTLVNTNFSSKYSFIEGGGDGISENLFSNINNNQNNQHNNIMTPEDTKKKDTLSNDYDNLLKARNNEFKSVERY